MPMSTDGKRDMFWRSDWDPVAQAAQCMEQYGVSPGEGWGATEYGGYDSWSQGESESESNCTTRLFNSCGGAHAAPGTCCSIANTAAFFIAEFVRYSSSSITVAR